VQDPGVWCGWYNIGIRSFVGRSKRHMAGESFVV
jgi:hypothetical protein